MPIKIIYLAIFIPLISACAPKRDLVYFSDMANAKTISSTQNQEVIISQNDIISISMTSLSQESNILFANNKIPSSANSLNKNGYKVNKSGIVYLPIIGNFKVAGLTIEDAQNKIESELSKYVKSPQVDIQLINFRITVIGEVNKPSTFIIPGEKVNLLEALGMAGDMTVYGKRENVLIIRVEDNRKTVKRLNLNKQETLNSPYFSLIQNDIVYVEPDRSKAVEFSQNTRALPLVIASISALAVLVAVLLKR